MSTVVKTNISAESSAISSTKSSAIIETYDTTNESTKLSAIMRTIRATNIKTQSSTIEFSIFSTDSSPKYAAKQSAYRRTNVSAE